MNSLWQNVRSTRFVVLFTLAIFLFPAIHGYAAPDGKALFKAKCSACHYASEKKSTGPGLKDALGRIPGGDWKYNWVHNSSKVIASGDAYAVNRFNEFNHTQMTPFPDLTNEEIDAILTYASNGEGGGTKVATSECVPEQGTQKAGDDEGTPWFMIVLLLVVLIILIAILRFTKINLRNAVNEKEGLPEEPALPFIDASREWMNSNKRKVALIGLFLFCVLIVKGWYALKGIGVYAEEVHPDEWVGYHPTQPINFSHKVHAGDNAIQCQYCHATVEKSKTASIPSANICMNCHKVIQEMPGCENSKAEIAKIYYAVGWDPDKGAYTGETHPIQWVKVHVLADFVFFSHQQHVVVGQVQCDQCHGDVKSMTTIQQQRPLTMGWCVNCHRTTPLKMDGNGYYTALHEKMKEKYKDQPITVSMVGGIECARCHY